MTSVKTVTVPATGKGARSSTSEAASKPLRLRWLAIVALAALVVCGFEVERADARSRGGGRSGGGARASSGRGPARFGAAHRARGVSSSRTVTRSARSGSASRTVSSGRHGGHGRSHGGHRANRGYHRSHRSHRGSYYGSGFRFGISVGYPYRYYGSACYYPYSYGYYTYDYPTSYTVYGGYRPYAYGSIRYSTQRYASGVVDDAPPIDDGRPPLIVGAGAWADLAEGRYEQAMRTFSAEAQARPDDGVPKVGYALAAIGWGDLDRGVWAMRRALRLDPSGARRVQPDERLRPKIEQWIDAYGYESKLSVNEADASFMTAAMNYLLRNTDEARGALQTAASAGDRSPSRVNLDRLVQADTESRTAPQEPAQPVDAPTEAQRSASAEDAPGYCLPCVVDGTSAEKGTGVFFQTTNPLQRWFMGNSIPGGPPPERRVRAICPGRTGSSSNCYM